MARKKRDESVGLVSPAELEKYKLQAQAVMEERRRAGQWSAGIQPHPYQKKPLEWIVKYLGVPEHRIRWSMNSGYENHEWDGSKDPLVQILDSLANWEDCGVESATGTGKTYLAACIVLWFLACHEDSLVVTAAPKKDQLLHQVWMEIGKLAPRFKQHFPDAEFTTGKIRMKPDEDGKEVWAAIAFVCGVGADEEAATKAQGFHRPDMLFITEETPGIHTAIMTSLFHTRTDDHNLHLALGNPDHQQDELHRFCFDAKGKPVAGVNHVQISAFDFPNIVTEQPIIPGAIGAKRLAKRMDKYGEGTRLYGSRIRGISPAEAEDALIKWEWCVAAANRYNDDSYREGELALGADVADAPEGDPAAIAHWQGRCCTDVSAFKVNSADDVGDRIYIEATNRDHPIDPKRIGIDAVGVGASAVNRAKKLGLKLRAIHGSARTVPMVDVETKWRETATEDDGTLKPAGPTIIEAEKYLNLRSQVWWRAREDLRLGVVSMPFDEELFQDLTTPTYTTKGGNIVIESKETIIERLRRSPNKGDAFCYGNFVRKRGKAGTVVEVEQVNTRDVDQGLERRLYLLERKQKAEEKRYQRMFARRYRRKRT